MEIDERPTKSWPSLFSPHKVRPDKITLEINGQDLVQLRVTQRPEIEEVKKCSFSYIFQILFKPAKKMATANSAISLSTISSEAQLEEDTSNPPVFIKETGDHISVFGEEKSETGEKTPLFVISERPSSRKVRFSSDEELIPLKQKHIEFIPISKVSFFQDSDDESSSKSSDISDDEFDDIDDKFDDEFSNITDEYLTFIANKLITGLFPSCNIGKFGKFTLNDEHGPFTEELSFDTSWFIKKNDSKITGLAIRWYDEDDDRDDEYAAVVHKTLLIPEY